MENKNTLNEYKLTAKSTCASVTEPFVDWFEAETEAQAIEQWKAQAIECGIELSDIQLVSVVLVGPVTSN